MISFKNQDLFGMFSKSLESRFLTLILELAILVRMFNRFLSAPSVAAGHTEPTPDRPPLAPYTDSLGGNLGGPAASEAPKGMDSLTHIGFGKFLDRVRELELQFVFVF